MHINKELSMAYNYKYSYTPKTINPVNKRHGSDSDEDDGDMSFPFLDAVKKKPYRSFEQTFSAQHVHYYLSKSIGEPDEYTDMIHRMTIADPQDVIFIHLNTPGGQLDTGIQIINAMQNSEAKIVTVLESMAYSLGTLIFLAGDEMVVNENCLMMFHNFKGGLIGKGNEMVSELAATVVWFETLAKDIYIPFLSEDELNRVIKGEDIWMQTAEIRTRLENMVKVLNEEDDSAKAAAVSELEELQEEAAKVAIVALKAANAAKRLAAKKVPVKKVAAKKTRTRKVVED